MEVSCICGGVDAAISGGIEVVDIAAVAGIGGIIGGVIVGLGDRALPLLFSLSRPPSFSSSLSRGLFHTFRGGGAGAFRGANTFWPCSRASCSFCTHSGT